MTLSFDIANLERLYVGGEATPGGIVREVYARIRARGVRPDWITLVDEEDAIAKARAAPRGRLYGIPFAVKDNIDVAGLPTTCACPEFAYVAERSAMVVERLEQEGAILIGKTNLDQFATGLNGTRSPYGIPASTFNPDYIAGGSSSGSAVAVAAGLVSFALGTDTAGSGRVPACLQQHRRAQADQGPDQHARRGAGLPDARRGLDLCSHRRRRGESGDDRNRLRRGGSFRAAGGAVLCRRSRAGAAESGCAQRTDPVFRRQGL